MGDEARETETDLYGSSEVKPKGQGFSMVCTPWRWATPLHHQAPGGQSEGWQVWGQWCNPWWWWPMLSKRSLGQKECMESVACGGGSPQSIKCREQEFKTKARSLNHQGWPPPVWSKPLGFSQRGAGPRGCLGPQMMKPLRECLCCQGLGHLIWDSWSPGVSNPGWWGGGGGVASVCKPCGQIPKVSLREGRALWG
jgi:hypothetical protein